jgi:outer membrane protein
MLQLALLALGLQASTLTLDAAERAAIAHQPQIQQAHAQSEAADARADQARAPLLPQVVGTATYQRTTANRVLRVGTDPRILAAQAPPNSLLYNWYRFDLSATQIIYDFGQTTGKWSASQANARAQAETERAIRLAVLANVRLAFFSALAQERLMEVAAKVVENQKRHLAQVEGYVAAKARPEIDLAQAQMDVANAEVQFIAAENAYSSSKAQLNQAMGVDQETDYNLIDASLDPVQGEDGPTDAMLTQALLARPEFATLNQQAKAQEELERSALGSYGPTLSVGAAASDRGTDLGQLRWNYYGAVVLTWPIFEGMLTPARVREARANLQAIVAQSSVLRQQVRLDIEKARLSLRAAKTMLKAADRAVNNADVRLRLAEGRYEAGVGNAVEFGDAIVAQAAAAAQKVQSQYLVYTARSQLRLALGRE